MNDVGKAYNERYNQGCFILPGFGFIKDKGKQDERKGDHITSVKNVVLLILRF